MSVRTAITEAPSSLVHRIIAVFGLAVVLLLGTAAVAPALHDWLHGHDDGEEQIHHQCAVAVFASGITLAAATIGLMGATLAWRPLVPPSVSELFLPAPRYLRQPERGPPIG